MRRLLVESEQGCRAAGVRLCGFAATARSRRSALRAEAPRYPPPRLATRFPRPNDLLWVASIETRCLTPSAVVLRAAADHAFNLGHREPLGRRFDRPGRLRAGEATWRCRRRHFDWPHDHF